MRKSTLTLILFLCCAGITLAQQSERITVQQVTANKSGFSKSPGSSFTKDNLYHNKFPLISTLNNLAADASQAASITQKGDYNRSTITQSGAGNAGMINVNGSYNKTDMTQVGSDFSVLNVIGDGNTFSIDQQDQGLKNYIKVHGSGINISANQTAAGMELSQRGTGGIPLTVRIPSTGPGRMIPVIIKNH
jgi:hypothetical protein